MMAPPRGVMRIQSPWRQASDRCRSSCRGSACRRRRPRGRAASTASARCRPARPPRRSSPGPVRRTLPPWRPGSGTASRPRTPAAADSPPRTSRRSRCRRTSARARCRRARGDKSTHRPLRAAASRWSPARAQPGHVGKGGRLQPGLHAVGEERGAGAEHRHARVIDETPHARRRPARRGCRRRAPRWCRAAGRPPARST